MKMEIGGLGRQDDKEAHKPNTHLQTVVMEEKNVRNRRWNRGMLFRK
jgi:hypothetical protein